MKNIETFLNELEAKINTGKKGAQVRRELHQRVVATYKKHKINLTSGKLGYNAERRSSYFDTEKGFNIPCGLVRHCPSDPKRRADAIAKRKRLAVVREIIEKVKNPVVDNAEALKLSRQRNVTMLPKEIQNALMVESGIGINEILKLSASKTSSSVQIGPWTVTTKQDVEEDRNFYSKAWHRAHGPKRTIINRRIIFTRAWGKGRRELIYNLQSWAGSFVEKAIVELGLHPTSKIPLTIRLNKAYGAELVDVKRGYKIYRRSLLGKPVDWVIVSPLGMTYHDSTRAKLVKGLHKKIRQQSRKLHGLVDWSVCRTLGFCDEGIREFCDIFGLDTASSYTPTEIEKAVKTKPECAAPFMSELRTLSKSFNYQVAECK